jgi:arylsulfatase A-like enzyme
MTSRPFITLLLLTALAVSLPAADQPNILWIMADDLGYGDLPSYGQTRIQTPNLDRLAASGTRFTNVYAGSTVCAPSRSVLMTGQHTGHTRVRGNFALAGGSEGYKGDQKVRRLYLFDDDPTVGKVLQSAGYRTALVGKWHLEAYEKVAVPWNRGFDQFYGRLMHTPVSSRPTYFPEMYHDNASLLPVPGNANEAKGTYQTDFMTDKAIEFMRDNKERPWYAFLSYSNPHDPFIVPDLGPYADRPWTVQQMAYAAMVTRLDWNIGRLLKQLQQMGLDENTVVFFCSDNGPRSSSNNAEQTRTFEFFDSNGPLRGYKRDMYEGGIRVPMIVRWTGKIAAGRTSAAPWYFADFLPTAADLAGAELPPGIDGVSVVPTLLGQPQDTADRFFYWEFYERGFQQAVRWRNWKAIRLAPGAPLKLYDLAVDVGEDNNIAALHPDIVRRIEQYLKTARTESEHYPLP